MLFRSQTEIKKIELELKKFANLDSKILLLEDCKKIKTRLDSLTIKKNNIENIKIKRDLIQDSIQSVHDRLKSLRQLLPTLRIA